MNCRFNVADYTPQRRSAEHGFTVMELLIALFLTSIVVVFVMNTYINQHKIVNIQEQVTETQQGARAAIDELTRQVRMAGYAIPLGLPAIASSNTNPDTITINYNSRNCTATLSDPMPQPSAELKLRGGQDLSCYHDGMFAYIFAPDSGGGEFFEITEVQDPPGHLQHNKDVLSRAYPAGSIVLSLDRVKFFVDNSDTTNPKLMVQINNNPPNVYAEHIEDLQFKYTLKNGLVVDEVTRFEDVRAVQISVRGRTADPDPDFPEDPYRYRTYTSSVNPRNIGS